MMNGISGCASIVAVISLAIQLGEAACKLAQFFATVEDAPNEIVRLRDMRYKPPLWVPRLQSSTSGDRTMTLFQA